MEKVDNRAIFSLFENAIRETKIVDYYPYNKSYDFNYGDIVECSYIKGLFRVTCLTSTFVIIEIINRTVGRDDIFCIGPEFIKKTTISNTSLKVLFNARN